MTDTIPNERPEVLDSVEFRLMYETVIAHPTDEATSSALTDFLTERGFEFLAAVATVGEYVDYGVKKEQARRTVSQINPRDGRTDRRLSGGINNHTPDHAESPAWFRVKNGPGKTISGTVSDTRTVEFRSPVSRPTEAVGPPNVLHGYDSGKHDSGSTMPRPRTPD